MTAISIRQRIKLIAALAITCAILTTYPTLAIKNDQWERMGGGYIFEKYRKYYCYYILENTWLRFISSTDYVIIPSKDWRDWGSTTGKVTIKKIHRFLFFENEKVLFDGFLFRTDERGKRIQVDNGLVIESYWEGNMLYPNGELFYYYPGRGPSEGIQYAWIWIFGSKDVSSKYIVKRIKI